MAKNWAEKLPKNWAEKLGKNWAEKMGKKLGGKNWAKIEWIGEYFMNSGISWTLVPKNNYMNLLLTGYECKPVKSVNFGHFVNGKWSYYYTVGHGSECLPGATHPKNDPPYQISKFWYIGGILVKEASL